MLVLYRVVVIALCGWGATTDLGTAFAFADVTMGLLALANLFALVMLFKTGLRLMNDYDRQVDAAQQKPDVVARLALVQQLAEHLDARAGRLP